MVSPVAGAGNMGMPQIPGMSGVQGMGGLDKAQASPVQPNIMDYDNIENLDEFPVEEPTMDVEESPAEPLKGSISQTQIPGMPQIQTPVAGASSGIESLVQKDNELANDLKSLAGKGIDSISSDKNSKDAANSFSKILNGYLDSTNKKQKEYEDAVGKFATGGDIDLHTVMIASEKANLSMQLTVQMRNKILQAYQEIQRIHV